MAPVRGAQSGANQAEWLRHCRVLDDPHGSCVAISNHPHTVLPEEKARCLRDVSGRVMQTEVGLEVGTAALGEDFPVLVVVEFVDHDAVVARELADVLDDGVAEEPDVPARERLEAGDGADGELLGLDGASYGDSGVLGAGGLEVDDDADVDAVEDGVEGPVGDPGVDPERVEQRDLAGGEGALEEDAGGGDEEEARVGAEGDGGGRGGGVERRDGVVGRQVEQVGGVLGVGEEAEGGVVGDGERAAEGLDVAAALDAGEVGGDLLLGGGSGRREQRLGVVEAAARRARLLEHGVEAGVEGVLRHGLGDGLRGGGAPGRASSAPSPSGAGRAPARGLRVVLVRRGGTRGGRGARGRGRGRGAAARGHGDGGGVGVGETGPD